MKVDYYQDGGTVRLDSKPSEVKAVKGVTKVDLYRTNDEGEEVLVVRGAELIKRTTTADVVKEGQCFKAIGRDPNEQVEPQFIDDDAEQITEEEEAALKARAKDQVLAQNAAGKLQGGENVPNTSPATAENKTPLEPAKLGGPKRL